MAGPTKMPAPPKRAPSPSAAAPPPPAARPFVGPVMLSITGTVTIPATTGYARRLTNLIEQLRRSIEEEAPWLTNVSVTVDTPQSQS